MPTTVDDLLLKTGKEIAEMDFETLKAYLGPIKDLEPVKKPVQLVGLEEEDKDEIDNPIPVKSSKKKTKKDKLAEIEDLLKYLGGDKK